MRAFSRYWVNQFSRLRLKAFDKRWIQPQDLEAVFIDLPATVVQSAIGTSYEGRPIHCLTIGTGSKKVVAWAAMHGNESTALRGWMDLFVHLDHPDVKRFFEPLLETFTIHFIPQLNPDGGANYLRRNAQGIDLNRDAAALQTPEMQALVTFIESIRPCLAFNLHDQRNIFAVHGRPATVSFLAPAVDVARSITPERERTMDLIGAAYRALAEPLEGCMGRYSDEYYPTAIGERMQQADIPTILVECGSAKNDPLRQKARMAMPIILEAVLNRLITQKKPDTSDYHAIPLNEKNQVDILIKGVQVAAKNGHYYADIALLAEESIVAGVYQSILNIADVGDLHQIVGLETYMWQQTAHLGSLKIGSKAHVDFATNQGQLTIEQGHKKAPHDKAVMRGRFIG
jgi:predicted deacylase